MLQETVVITQPNVEHRLEKVIVTIVKFNLKGR